MLIGLAMVGLGMADTGDACEPDDIQGGTWNGWSCHYEDPDAGIGCPSTFGVVFSELDCAEGSEVGYRVDGGVSDIGNWECDFGEDGESIGSIAWGLGTFCCDGHRTGLGSAGNVYGTCIAATVVVPDDLEDEPPPSGCGGGQAGAFVGLGLVRRRARLRRV